MTVTAGPLTPASAPPVAPLTLEGRDVAHRYTARTGLDPVSFALAAPGIAAITGANGAGKSTLLRVIAGLLRPTHGASTLTLAGRAIPSPDRRRWVGYAGPDLAFYEEMSSVENLSFAAEARGIDAAENGVAAALQRVGLEGRGHDRVAALSSGMRQRLRIAFALLHRPPLLLLDEPGSHLDEEGREVLFRLIADEGRRGLVLIATNDEREWKLAEQRIELHGRGLGHPA